MNYKKLIEDYNNNTLDKNKIKLIMDNDSGYFSIDDDSMTEAAIEKLSKKLLKTYGEPGGYEDVVEILNAVGVPCEWC